MLQHTESYPRVRNYPPQSSTLPSATSRASESRSAEAEKLLEVARTAIRKAQHPFTFKTLQLAFPTLSVEILEDLLKNRESDRRSKIQTCNPKLHHDSLHTRRKLCKCEPCTTATAQGRRNPPQRYQVRARVNFMFCPLCDEPLRTPGQARSHYLSFHTTKMVLRNIHSLRYMPISEDEYSEPEEEDYEDEYDGAYEVEEEDEEQEENLTERRGTTIKKKKVDSDSSDETEDSENTRL